jgi:PAS domain S-box-containing protein
MIAPFDREAVLEETIADLEAIYEWHALILNQAKVGVLDWPVNDSRVYMSPALKSILGYRDEDLPNAFSEWVRHIHVEDRASVESELREAVDSGNATYQRVHRVTRKDGSDGWILFRGKVTPGDEGRSCRLLGAVIDISDIRQQIADSTSAATAN